MHDRAVCPELLDILHTVADDPAFEPISLGGGTSLALRFGHRRSINIDLFTVGDFDSERLDGLRLPHANEAEQKQKDAGQHRVPGETVGTAHDQSGKSQQK
jgi:hypothetical protein